jgi:PAS domain S-box-containing protein
MRLFDAILRATAASRRCIALRQDRMAKSQDASAREPQGRPNRVPEPGTARAPPASPMISSPTGAPMLTDDDVGYPSDHRFRLLVESVKEYAIFILDPEGRVSSWNLGARRIKGYDAAEILGKHFSVFYPPEEVAAGKCEQELVIASREGRCEEEGWRVRKDGSRFWANVVITALRSDEGRLLGFAKVTQDLTARVLAQRERAIGLERAAASRRKDDFIAVMSHELRNPLASIVATAEVVRVRGGQASEAEMATIDRQARHMTRLVDDLLDASRALRENVPLVPVPIEIARVLGDAIELAHRVMRERDHVLTANIPDLGLLVSVDVERMAQVFGNILTNAAKYTPPGGRIHVTASTTLDEVAVSVEDNGEGIAPELLDQMFEPFVQGDQGLDRKRGGLGVGLAIARKLVRAHHGEITAESPGRGRGSRLTVRLPRVAMPSVSDEPPPSPARPRHRILLIDDNRDFVESLQLLMESLGHEALAVFDGPSGVAAALAFQPELVFLDLGLPEVSGYEVVGRLRRVVGCETIPIIAISGYAREADRALALESGFTSHLAKPINFAGIEKAIADSFS